MDKNAVNDTLSRLEKRLGYSFKDKELLVTAITHRSYIPEGRVSHEHNERLEFLGDAVLGLIISDILFRRFGRLYREGDLTKMRAFLVSEARLFELSAQLGIGEVILLGRGEEKSGGRKRPSILADTFEAITGAIYLDGGFESAYSFVERQFRELIECVVDEGLSNDYKTMLQELTQRYFQALPSYKLIEMRGPDHDRVFEVALFFNDEEMAIGVGKSKKEAEQQAAKIAFEKLKRQVERDGF